MYKVWMTEYICMFIYADMLGTTYLHMPRRSIGQPFIVDTCVSIYPDTFTQHNPIIFKVFSKGCPVNKQDNHKAQARDNPIESQSRDPIVKR